MEAVVRWALLSPLLSSRGLRWEGSFLLLGLVSTLMIGRESAGCQICGNIFREGRDPEGFPATARPGLPALGPKPKR